MEDMQNFIDQLDSAIQKKTQEFNKKILPSTRESYNIQGTAAHAIRNILLKKSLIHDDPYRYDSKLADIEMPETESFSDSEKASVIGARLAHYEMMLDFLNNYYQFNTQFLTPKKISTLLKFNKSFIWSDFTTTSNHPNTKALADIIQGIFSGTDKLSSSLIRDSLSHLARTEKNIDSQLKELSYLHKEEYKLMVRKNMSGKVQIKEEDTTNPSKILKEIKKICLTENKKKPFYTDLIVEILKEDYSKNKDNFQTIVLKRLGEAQSKQTNLKKSEDFRHFLISGFKLLGNTTPHFKEALEKIKQNDELIFNQKMGLFQKLIKALKSIFNISNTEKELNINIIDPITQTKTKQTINYAQFEKEMTKKAILFDNISIPNSQVQQKIKSFNDHTLLAHLEKNITGTNDLLKQMAGLDEFYKTVKPELRGKIRGIKIEITTITNSLIKANQLRAEYTTAVEENVQMKKLGIS